MVLPHENMAKATGCPGCPGGFTVRVETTVGGFNTGPVGKGPGCGFWAPGWRVWLFFLRGRFGEGIPMDPWFEMGKDRGTIWLFNVAMV